MKASSKTAVVAAVKVENVSKRFWLWYGVLEALLSIRAIERICERTPFLRALLRSNVVLEDVSFEIDQGSIFGIFGVNGTGKSTLVNCISSLLAPEHGRILIYGEDVQTLGPRLGQVLSKCNREEVYRQFSALENAEFVARLHGLEPAAAKDVAVELLDALGVTKDDQSAISADRLSVGTKGKVALVCSLLPLLQISEEASERAPILVLDEPSRGFDVISVEQLFRAIRKLQECVHGLTVIIATNDPREASWCDDHVSIVDARTESDPERLKALQATVAPSRESAQTLSELIGGTRQNEGSSMELTKTAEGIPLAKNGASLYSTIRWRDLTDMKHQFGAWGQALGCLIVPAMIGLFASAESRGLLPAFTMAFFGLYISMLFRGFFRFFERERFWFNMLELLILSPVSRGRHIVAMSSHVWMAETVKALLCGILLFAIITAGTGNVTHQELGHVDVGGLCFVVALAALASWSIGLACCLLPFFFRAGKAFFITTMLPNLLLISSGIFNSPENLPPAVAWIQHINPITYASAALIECMHFEFSYSLLLSEELASKLPNVSMFVINVSVLFALTLAYGVLAAAILRYGERHLRALGRMRNNGL